MIDPPPRDRRMVSSFSASRNNRIDAGKDEGSRQPSQSQRQRQQVHRRPERSSSVGRHMEESRDEQPQQHVMPPPSATAESSEDRDAVGNKGRAQETTTGTSRMDLNQSLGSSSTAHHMQQLKSLSWRADPRTSFSDWTLEIVGIEGGVDKTVSQYYAHSNVIAWGPRKGGYFVQLFQERMQQHNPSNMSRIQVRSTEAEVFPIMLDFMYCENSLPLSADKACVLYAMADRFIVPQLQKAIQKFVERYLNLGQMIEFISYARQQQDYTHKEIDKLILCAVSKLCGHLVKRPKEAKDVEPALLLYTLEQRAKVLQKLKDEDSSTYSEDWEAERAKLLSKVVAECCKAATTEETKLANGEYPKLSRLQFQHMMTHLPALDDSAAMVLMQVDRKLISEDRSTSNHGTLSLSQQQQQPETTASASNFNEKCVEVMAVQWRKGMLQKSEKENERLIEFLEELSPKVLAKLLVKVSQQYEVDILIAEESAAEAAAEAGASPRYDLLSEPSRKSNVSTKVNINHHLDYPSPTEVNEDHQYYTEPLPSPDRYHTYDI